VVVEVLVVRFATVVMILAIDVAREIIEVFVVKALVRRLRHKVAGL
jgi:hypothetical protein